MQVQINEDLQDKAEPVSDGAQEGDLVIHQFIQEPLTGRLLTAAQRIIMISL